MADHPLRPATRHRLGRPLPHQRADGTRAPLEAPACQAEASFPPEALQPWSVWGISPPFEGLSPSSRQVTHVLLTRSPLSLPSFFRIREAAYDLHVLGTPPAFVLSQDQTLHDKPVTVLIEDLIPGFLLWSHLSGSRRNIHFSRCTATLLPQRQK